MDIEEAVHKLERIDPNNSQQLRQAVWILSECVVELVNRLERLGKEVERLKQ